MAKTPGSKGKPVAVVVGATSKWQSDGRNTKLVHGKAVDDSDLPVARCYIRDPFGNRIELDDERDAGFSAG